MKYISKYQTLNELKGLLKLVDEEIVEWSNFRKKVLLKMNRLYVKHANQKRPICAFCGKPMQNYTPDKGKFKGQVQKHCWTCPCHFNLVISIG